MRPSDRHIREQSSKIGLGAEGLRVLWIQLQELPHVKDLDLVIDRFRADDEVIAIDLDLTPDRWGGLLWETADVDELTGFCDFCKGGAVFLADGDEFTAGVLVGPAYGDVSESTS